MVVETLLEVSSEAAHVGSEGWLGDLGTSKPWETPWMVKMCQLSDILLVLVSHWPHIPMWGKSLAKSIQSLRDEACIAKKAWKTGEQLFPLTCAWPREKQDLSRYLNFSMYLSVVLNGDPLEL